MLKPLTTASIMTGNSFDGADLLETSISPDGTFQDLSQLSVELPERLREDLLRVRATVQEEDGNVQASEAAFDKVAGAGAFNKALSAYNEFVASCFEKLQQSSTSDNFDLIGFHGQTVAHRPPSISGKDGAYTVQIGNGQELATRLGTTTVSDFRSDDVLKGGEGAPLAPLHHLHLAKQRNLAPIAFCNGGNSSNYTIITQSISDGKDRIISFDPGPFNHFSDLLVRAEKNVLFDRDGELGQSGEVSEALLRILYNHAACTADGKNYLEQQAPKSSDPQWYRTPPELADGALLNLSFEDRLRTAQYFSAYLTFLALRFIPEEFALPKNFALCGGGWNNPNVRGAFEKLLAGDPSCLILPEQKSIAQTIISRLGNANDLQCALANEFGVDSVTMEARIFADAAVCRIKNEAFSLPETTGVSEPTILGVIHFPNGDSTQASPRLQAWIEHFKTNSGSESAPAQRWSRAARQ